MTGEVIRFRFALAMPGFAIGTRPIFHIRQLERDERPSSSASFGTRAAPSSRSLSRRVAKNGAAAFNTSAVLAPPE